MTEFILNDRFVSTDLSPGTTLLDFIRYTEGLTGTKIGCREGDCGACTVLEGVLSARGDLSDGQITYRTIVSCLTPLGNAHGKHIVTVEGLNMEALSPVQQAFVDHNGTQCGFCTPGFVVSLTGYAMTSTQASSDAAIASMDGNICRCTGYKSIERAAISVSKLLKEKDPAAPMEWLIAQGILPAYFSGIADRLMTIPAVPVPTVASGYQKPLAVAQAKGHPPAGASDPSAALTIMGGGTDLMVQRPEKVAESKPLFLLDHREMRGIRFEGSRVVIGASTTASDIMHDPLMQQLFPRLTAYFRLISSDPIRNMGTLAGNLVNASPIGDLSIFFLALDATLVICPAVDSLHDPAAHRSIPLRKFFLGYKELALQPGELVCSLSFPVPTQASHFNFEKVSKRTHLDIASVNEAMALEVLEDTIVACHASCGGVAPVPLYLKRTSALMAGKPLVAATLVEAAEALQQEISPISDVRGTATYKRLLARQLFLAHFMQLFPDRFDLKELTQNPLPS